MTTADRQQDDDSGGHDDSTLAPLNAPSEKLEVIDYGDPPTYPARFNVGMMAFLGAVLCYVTRSNFSLNLIAMVNPTTNQTQNNATTLPDYGPRFDWSSHEQSMLLGAFFYGYAISAVPIGFIADRYGVAKATIFYIFLLTAVLEMLSPMAAHMSFEMSFVVRLSMGLLQGGFYPAVHKLYSKWAPPNELGKFSAACLGSCAGTVFTWLVTGTLIEHWGWKNSFYLPAMLVGVFALCWYFIVFDTPGQHPRITPYERNYIESSLNSSKSSRNSSFPPIKEIAMSPPVWALLFLQFGSDWGVYFILTGVPKFLNEILGFQLTSTGVLASLPYMARWISSVLFGFIVDSIRSNTNLSVTNIRKVLCVFSHLLPGLFVLIIPYVSQHPYWCVACMTISFGFNGAVAHTALCNYHDLAPNYAATLNSIINGFGSCAGFISPMIVSYFTSERNTIDEWQYVFMIGAGVYMAPAFLYMVFGSGELQPWNAPKKKNQGDELS